MNRYLTSRRAALAAIGGLVAALSLSGVAMAITDNVFMYSTPKNGHLTLTAAAFTPSLLTKDYVSNGGAIRPLTAGQTCWSAAVNLPESAKVIALALYYHLESGDTALVQFTRQRLSDGVPTLIVSENLPVTGGLYEAVNHPITDASVQTVDNRRYGYFVYVCIAENGTGNTTAFRGTRITYTYATAGD